MNRDHAYPLNRAWARGLCTTPEQGGIARDARPSRGESSFRHLCPSQAEAGPPSSCRQTLTVEALGWTEFSLCCVTLGATLLWMRTGLGKRRSVRDSRTFV